MDGPKVMVPDWGRTEIRALRMVRRITVREFAAHLGVTARAVSFWERATAPARPRQVNQAALDASLRQADADTRRRFIQLLTEWTGSVRVARACLPIHRASMTVAARSTPPK
ncbi:hypothetical protein GCM10025762_45220 [Haloechinothrix salitolerans]